MNHVAHCFLSYADPERLLGNFIGDYVKGRAWQDYTPGVQQGILLHRSIDAFTDNHPKTRESVRRIRDYAGRYGAPVMDVLYDHLLCLHWNRYAPSLTFDVFSAWVYSSLDQHESLMPDQLSRRWPQMRAGKFLQGYQSREGLDWVLGQFSKRLNGHLDAGGLHQFFFRELDQFSADFNAFFPDLLEHLRVRENLL